MYRTIHAHIQFPERTERNHIPFDERCGSLKHIRKLLPSFSKRRYRLRQVVDLIIRERKVLRIHKQESVYWSFSGDYKFYLFLQFFSPLLLALIIGMFRPRYSSVGYLVAAFALYAAAKFFETFDYPIYRLTGVISGHSLKHITAALSCLCILRMLQVRKQISTISQMQKDEFISKDQLSWVPSMGKD